MEDACKERQHEREGNELNNQTFSIFEKGEGIRGGRRAARNIRGRCYSKCRVKCNLQPRRWLFIR